MIESRLDADIGVAGVRAVRRGAGPEHELEVHAGCQEADTAGGDRRQVEPAMVGEQRAAGTREHRRSADGDRQHVGSGERHAAVGHGKRSGSEVDWAGRGDERTLAHVECNFGRVHRQHRVEEIRRIDRHDAAREELEAGQIDAEIGWQREARRAGEDRRAEYRRRRVDDFAQVDAAIGVGIR